MEEHDIIVAIAVVITGAFVTGSVAFVIKSIIQDIEQAKETAKQDTNFNRSEINGLKTTLQHYQEEERKKDDDLKAKIELAKGELREDIKDSILRAEAMKQELRGELHMYWDRVEKVLEARRQDVYQLHAKIEAKHKELSDKIDEVL